MSKQHILEALQSAEVFQDMDEPFLDKLAEIGALVSFHNGDILFKENAEAESVYLIVDGDVDLFLCRPEVGCRSLMVVGPGDLVGWSPLVGRTRWSDSARAMTELTWVVAFPARELLHCCQQDPASGLKLMSQIAEVLSDRLGATRSQLLGMTGHQLPEVALESD
ncbi:MAG: cyclic nucleotide-binding domain-containing protein [Planctomycetales bacterium]|nr:cyclic nucleotide-binding domain-containing protein [Planctomycetales bacterium]